MELIVIFLHLIGSALSSCGPNKCCNIGMFVWHIFDNMFSFGYSHKFLIISLNVIYD